MMRHRMSAVIVACLALGTAALGQDAAQDSLPRTVTINALGFYGAPGTAGGVCSPVRITVDRNSGGTMRVAFIEGEVGSYGEMWRAAAWMSTVLAADLIGFDPSRTQLSFEMEGRIDGPSAGALMTVGVLAALRGDQVRADAAMTGTINPDGTIGPVGGIPHKIDGAAQAGMKLVLIPYGLRHEADQNQQREVDLFERGRDQGIEVRAVGDIYTAYELLTGSQLPRAAPAPAPQLDDAAYQRIRLKVDEWLVRFGQFDGSFASTPEEYRYPFSTGRMDDARASKDRVKQLLAEGQAPAAYRDAIRAAARAAIAAEVTRTIWVDRVRGRQEAESYVRQFANIDAKMQIAIDRLKQYQPRNLGAAGVLLAGYGALTEAMAYRAVAEALLRGELSIPVNDSNADQPMEDMLTAVCCLQIAALDCEHIRDLLEVAGDLEGPPIPANAPLEMTADFFRRAAEANLNQFERIVVGQLGEARGLSFDQARLTTMIEEEDYLIARIGHDVAMRQLREVLGPGVALRYAELGAAISRYTLSSLLLSTYYSLRVTRDQEGNAVGLRAEGPLKFMLDFTEDQARRNIRLLEDHDVDATSVIVGYQAASIIRGRDLDDQLEALTWLWEANVVSRTLAYLGGFAVPQSPEAVKPKLTRPGSFRLRFPFWPANAPVQSVEGPGFRLSPE